MYLCIYIFPAKPVLSEISAQTVPDAISHAAGGPEASDETYHEATARAAGSPSFKRAAVSPRRVLAIRAVPLPATAAI